MVSDDLILEHTPSKAFRTKAQNAVHGIFNPLSQCQRTIITRHAVASTGGILFLIEDFFMGAVNSVTRPSSLFELRRTLLRLNGHRMAVPREAHKGKAWWSRTGSNRRPPACKAGALPIELRPLLVKKHRSTSQPVFALRATPDTASA